MIFLITIYKNIIISRYFINHHHLLSKIRLPVELILPAELAFVYFEVKDIVLGLTGPEYHPLYILSKFVGEKGN
jgi:hypothetical protein